MNTPTTIVRRRLLALAACAAFSSLATPAWAADATCLDENGLPTAADTNQGIENPAEGENTTCDPHASAWGWRNNASGESSSAFGRENIAVGLYSSAFGALNGASGDFSSAFGYANYSVGFASSAFGWQNSAGGISNSAFGYYNLADGSMASSAFGYWNNATGEDSSAFGWRNSANGDQSVAFGFAGFAAGKGALAFGGWWDRNGDAVLDDEEKTSAIGTSSVAMGPGATAYDNSSVAIGVGSVAGESSADTTIGRNSVAVGTWFDSDGDGVFDAGVDLLNSASGLYSSAFGVGNDASARSSTAVGAGNVASGLGSSAFGFGNYAMADFSTALGYQAVATEDGVVSFGHSAGDPNGQGGTYADERNARLLHVAAGIADTDAVNFGQLGLAMSSMAAALGGGATWDGFGITAPAFSIQGTTYASVGDALGAIDSWMSSHSDGVQYDDPSHETLTLDGADGTELKNVADGTEDGDAVNKGQMDDGDADALATANDYTDDREDAIREDMDAGDAATLDAANDYADAGDAATLAAANEHADAGDAATLASAQSYADAGDAATLASAQTYADAGDAATLASAQSYSDAGDARTLSSANAYTDNRFAAWNDTFAAFRTDMELRFAQTDERIDRMGAMGGAMSAAAINTAGLPGRNRVGVGVGVQGGHAALAIGYQRLVTPRASVSLGGAFSGEESSVSAGAGFSW